MTLDEKVAQLGSVWGSSLLEGRETFSREKACEHLCHGIGQITRPAGGAGIPPEQVARSVNDLQHYLIHETRLGIPALLHEQCLSGFQTVGATIFPQMIGVAATFDPDLVSEMTMVLRERLRALHIHQGLASVLDVARDVRWGRVEETCGEDPYLVSALCCVYVEGLRLRPGESRRVKFTVPAEILAFYDRSMRLVVEPGQFAVMIGSSSREIRLRGGFTITGETRIISVRKDYFSGTN